MIAAGVRSSEQVVAHASRGVSPGPLPISYLRRPRSTCPKYGRSLYAGSLARTCKRRDCPGYVAVWMGDQRVRLLENRSPTVA